MSVDFAEVFETASVGLLLLDASGGVRRANRRYCELVGRSEAELQTLSFRELTHPDDRKVAEEYWLRMLTGELESISLELRCLRRDGSALWVAVESSLRRDARGNPSYFSSVVVDVSQRREADDALRTRSAELAAANAALLAAARHKDEFLASMSHELRTPLNAVLGMSDALIQDLHGKLDPRQQRSLVLIEESGRHLLRLIDELLDLSRIDAGTLQLNPEIVAVHDVCAAALRAVGELAEARKQHITYRPHQEPLLVTADPARLKRVLAILLANAVKFTGHGGALGLEVELDRERETLELGVWDGGIGIDPEELPKLFKPFVQLDSGLSRQYGGLGLGLALAHRLVELHGGSISVSSAVGKGSRFPSACRGAPICAPTSCPRSAPGVRRGC